MILVEDFISNIRGNDRRIVKIVDGACELLVDGIAVGHHLGAGDTSGHIFSCMRRHSDVDDEPEIDVEGELAMRGKVKQVFSWDSRKTMVHIEHKRRRDR